MSDQIKTWQERISESYAEAYDSLTGAILARHVIAHGGGKNEMQAEIGELRAALSQSSAAVRNQALEEVIAIIPGGSWCDPQQICDAIRALKSAAPAVEPVAARDFELALDLLATFFDSYENGTACYDYSDGEKGAHIGNAVQIDDQTFHACCNLLNMRRPHVATPLPTQGEENA